MSTNRYFYKIFFNFVVSLNEKNLRMFRKNTFILLITSILFVFPIFSQSPKNIYITLDTSGSMYGDKYMISNYTAQLIALIERYSNVYMICNGLPKKFSTGVNSYKQIQFNYSQIRAVWGISPFGSQIGDIAAFNFAYSAKPDGENWIFIIGDGNWESYKFTPITDKFSEIIQRGNVKVFFIPYGNVNDGHSDFIEYLRTLKSPRILNGSRDLQSVISNCVIIFTYLTGNSGKNIQSSLINSKTVKVTSPLPVKKYTLFYQDITDENAILKPILAIQDSVNFDLNFLGTPSTSALRYKDNQTLLSATLWEISGKTRLEADEPLYITFDKTMDIKKLKFFPMFDYGINTKIAGLKTNPLKIEEMKMADIATNKDTIHKSNAVVNDTAKYSTQNKSKLKLRKEEKMTTLSENTATVIHLRKLKNNDSLTVFTASVKFNEKIDTNKYNIEITHSKPLLFKKATTRIDNNQITLTFESRGKWSDNFIPDTISLKAKLLPKNTIISDGTKLTQKTYEIKAETNQNKEKSLRNKHLSYLYILTSLLIIYIFALSRKARFKRGAILNYFTQQKLGKSELRKKGMLAWFNRWFNPFGAEKSNITFLDVEKTFTFVSNRTKYSIRIPQNMYDKNTMSYQEYSPTRNNYIEFIENREFVVKGELNNFVSIKYDSVPAVKDDRFYFRTALWSIAAIILFLLAII